MVEHGDIKVKTIKGSKGSIGINRGKVGRCFLDHNKIHEKLVQYYLSLFCFRMEINTIL